MVMNWRGFKPAILEYMYMAKKWVGGGKLFVSNINVALQKAQYVSVESFPLKAYIKPHIGQECVQVDAAILI